MKLIKAPFAWLALFASLVTAAAPAQASDKRIVVLGGDVTEIVYALGAGDQIVGVDTTSLYPEEALELPQLGYIRALNAEGILALAPDLVLASSAAGPPPVMAQLAKAGVPLVRVPQPRSLEGIETKINIVAEAIDATEQAAHLIAEVGQQTQRLQENKGNGPRVLFVMQVQGRGVMAAGQHTAADVVIRLAGAQNILGDMPGYKPVAAENLATQSIDVILFMAHSAETYGGMEAIKVHPALRVSDAVSQNRVWAVDEMALLGFGPRTPAALRELAEKLANYD